MMCKCTSEARAKWRVLRCAIAHRGMTREEFTL
jgi:hypothetical protein